MESDRLVKEAYAAIRKGRPGEAFMILEKLPKNGYDPYPLFLSALSSLMCDQIEQGLSFSKRLRAHYPEYIPGREIDAFIRIKSAKSKEDAVVALIELTPKGSDARHFRKLADRIRHTDDFETFQKKFSVKDCVRYSKHPPVGKSAKDFSSKTVHLDHRRKRNVFRVVLIFFITIICGAGGISGYLYLKQIDNRVTRGNEDVFSRSFIPDDRYPLIGKKSIEEKYSYENEDELRADYEKARMLMKNSKFNDALLILNRINNSNAQPGIRDRVQFLVKYISGISDRDAEMIPCGKISADPVLYRGVMISVTGIVKEAYGKKRTSSMSIIPDSDKNRIVEIFSNAMSNYKVNDRVKVEGIFSQTVGKESRLYVEARSVEKE